MENLENTVTEEKVVEQEQVFEIEEGLEVYKTVDVKPKKAPNKYQITLDKLASQQNLLASIPFPNKFLTKFKIAASKLKEKGYYFNFRIDVKNPDTHTRVWWTNVIPAKKVKKEPTTTTEAPDGEKGE